jgi:hypothetical protein
MPISHTAANRAREAEAGAFGAAFVLPDTGRPADGMQGPRLVLDGRESTVMNFSGPADEGQVPFKNALDTGWLDDGFTYSPLLPKKGRPRSPQSNPPDYGSTPDAAARLTNPRPSPIGQPSRLDHRQAAHGNAMKPRAPRISKEQWGLYLPIMRGLYRTKPLDEVMSVMRDEYDFAPRSVPLRWTQQHVS